MKACFFLSANIISRLVPFLLFMLLLPACKSKKHISKNEEVQAPVKNATIVSEKLGISEREVGKSNLYTFIGEWYGTPYKYGGCGKDGIDCSCFSGALYRHVYGKNLARSARDIYKDCNRVKESNLKEGDLLFFKIGSKDITHVGVYLKDRKFVHASTKKGVMISDLDEEFFKKTFYEAGRLR